MGASQSSKADGKRAIVLSYSRTKRDGSIDFVNTEMIAVGDISVTRDKIIEFLGHLKREVDISNTKYGRIDFDIFVPFVVTDEIATRIESLILSFRSFEVVEKLQSLKMFQILGTEYREGSMLIEMFFTVNMVSSENSEKVRALVNRISVLSDIGHKEIYLA